ncbi:hypothetical protein RBU61_06255 [Tissierella sp. MB52-C2]|uniref:hypothetical protein n=1 Tax=Tissierella sp. MB52-C2 TaxID=3070999 RepID=UPI00280C2857|nr:hypothetical protein [Tissierella sp. MB52-C2]WMM26275.1 hypothetical protein RBU61_06255 [Tissierella sp. MB52-C2]
MRNNLKRKLKSAFEAPAPIRKSIFLSQFDYPKASRFDFIKSQAGYIRKRVWVLSLLLFIGTLIGIYYYEVSTSIVWVVSSIFPFISLASIAEILRSTTYNMDELEISCKHNFLEVSLIRLGILGIANFAVLISILLLFMGQTDFGFFRLGLYLITPYLLNCYGSLFAINRLKSREITYICGIVTAFVSLLNALFTIQINDIYTERYWSFWLMSFIILTVLSYKEVVKLIKKMEGLQWNSSLTV